MERTIRQATNIITDSRLIKDEEMTELTKCSIEIGRIALASFSGDLRAKALRIATAIADYEDELKKLSDTAK